MVTKIQIIITNLTFLLFVTSAKLDEKTIRYD